MDKFKKKNSKFALTVSSLLFCSLLFAGVQFFSDSPSIQKAKADDEKQFQALVPQIKTKLDAEFKNAESWPSKVLADGDNLKINYAFNNELSGFVERLLSKYRSDYSTVVVIDNETGEIISAVGYEGRTKKFNTNLVLSSTHPAASLGKIITAANLVENSEVDKDSKFVFRGRSTTLYKYQINQTKQNKWDKSQSLETAFAVSNNVIFGKAAIEKSTIGSLSKTAGEFGFNKPYMHEFDFLSSRYPTTVEDNFHFAEIASGFNTLTVISPIHAAMMASVVANNGVLKTPVLIQSLVNEDGKLIWENKAEEKRILTARSTAHMKDMMEATTRAGTARKAFRKLKRSLKDHLDVGGKTGSLTGGTPFGKRDWFAFYVVPQDPKYGKGISVSIMNVNVKRWYVKSSALAREITEYYYGNIVPINEKAKPKSNIADSNDKKSAFISGTNFRKRNVTTSQFVSTKSSGLQKTGTKRDVKRKVTTRKVASAKVEKKTRKIASEKKKKRAPAKATVKKKVTTKKTKSTGKNR